MEFTLLDPFEDYATAGYLRNVYGERDLRLVAHLEALAFHNQVPQLIRLLRRLSSIEYEDITDTHALLFRSLYPWAGLDRLVTAPGIAIVKAGYNNLFAHPKDIKKAAEHALKLGTDVRMLRTRPGHVYGYLAYAHPFLEGNGRTILSIFAELCRRANFYIEWDRIRKKEFLQVLTTELQQPGSALDELLLPFLVEGKLSSRAMTEHLKSKFPTYRAECG